MTLYIIQYNTLNITLSNSQLSKSKSGAKNNKISSNFDDDSNDKMIFLISYC